jgi:YesN/AraC family two-component response regulator
MRESGAFSNSQIDVPHTAINTNTMVEDKSNDSKQKDIRPLVLIIDDDPEICNLVETILKPNYNVLKETNSQTAVDTVTKINPDLIILDIIMPEVNGLEVCQHIKNDIRISHIPIILLTGKTSTEDQIMGLETGADDYVHKPFNEKLLLARVGNIIKQREKLRHHFTIDQLNIKEEKLRNAHTNSFINQVYLTILENYQKSDFNVNSLADKMGMSRSSFYKKYKELADEPINDLIKNFRLSKAEELLLNPKYTISEVAYNVGFSDPAYFSKVFKEQYNITPKEFIISKYRH